MPYAIAWSFDRRKIKKRCSPRSIVINAKLKKAYPADTLNLVAVVVSWSTAQIKLCLTTALPQVAQHCSNSDFEDVWVKLQEDDYEAVLEDD